MSIKLLENNKNLRRHTFMMNNLMVSTIVSLELQDEDIVNYIHTTKHEASKYNKKTEREHKVTNTKINMAIMWPESS